MIRTFDTVVVVSERERDRLPAGAGSVLVCPNGQDLPVLLPPATAPVVAFVATLGWAPNVEAALWLGREIWPEVARRVPEARLLLVGRDPAPEVRALAGPRVEVTGTVPDVAPYLTQAQVLVAPLLAGGGTRLKIMEALGAGRPVVATSIGCDGLEDLVGRGVVVADTAGAMVEEITALLHDPGMAARLGCGDDLQGGLPLGMMLREELGGSHEHRACQARIRMRAALDCRQLAVAVRERLGGA